MAKVSLIDDFVAANGLIREGGEPQAVLKLYVSLENSGRLSLQRLQDSLRARPEVEPLRALQAEGQVLRLAAERRQRDLA